MAAKKKRRVGKKDSRPPLDWRREVYRLLPFVAVYVGLERVLFLLADSGKLAAVQAWTAVSARWLLGVFGMPTVISGTAVVTGAGMVTVHGLCLPITPIALGVALIACATSLSALRKVQFICVLIPLAFAISVIRIAVVAALVAISSPYMSVVHATVSPIVWTALPIALWLLALRTSSHG